MHIFISRYFLIVIIFSVYLGFDVI